MIKANNSACCSIINRSWGFWRTRSRATWCGALEMAVEHQPNDKQRGAPAHTTFGTSPPTTYHSCQLLGSWVVKTRQQQQHTAAGWAERQGACCLGIRIVEQQPRPTSVGGRPCTLGKPTACPVTVRWPPAACCQQHSFTQKACSQPRLSL